MREEILIIDWEDDQAGFIVHNLLVETAKNAYEYGSTTYNGCNLFKCIAPGNEVLDFMNSLNCEDFHSLIIKLIWYGDDFYSLDVGVISID